jgi:hypothetical protein
MDSCGSISWCQAPKVIASQDSRASNAYPLLKTHVGDRLEAHALPQVEGGGTGKQAVKSYPPARYHRVEKVKAWITPGIYSF